MNCSQARTLLAAYRELKNGQEETAALEEHLRNCGECRAYLAQGTLVGERIRALPEIELPADAHTKLLKALAVEHARFIQQAPAFRQSPPVPVFLAPYLKEHGQEIPAHIAAFSTADTGPLPVLQMPRRRKSAYRSSKMSPFVIVGLAAAFLMAIMVGGLTSFVMLARHGAPDVGAKVDIGLTSQLSVANYATTTTYTNIASAVGARNTIYYTASSTGGTWMLAALDNKTKVSTPLLAQASTNPLIVLSSSDNWLFWLRYDLPQQVVLKNQHTHRVISSYEGRAWSLEATYLGTDPLSTFTTATPITLQTGMFDADTAPTWVHTPIGGIWSGQDTLLVTTLDKQGRSHLTRYTLDAEKSPRASELASVGDGHILTSPTATTNGADIYWSEEWMTSDNVLHSDIWAQKTSSASLPLYGQWGHQANTDTYLFRANTAAFHPQVVNDTLFLLNVKNATIMNNAIPQVTATPTPLAAPVTQPTAQVPDRIATVFYTPLPDETFQGTLQAFSALDDSVVQLPSISDVVQVPQAGTRFLLWENSTRGFGMYDAVTRQLVPVGFNPLPSNATLLAVNGDTTIWNPANNTSLQTTQGASRTITFGTFSWPTR